MKISQLIANSDLTEAQLDELNWANAGRNVANQAKSFASGVKGGGATVYQKADTGRFAGGAKTANKLGKGLTAGVKAVGAGLKAGAGKLAQGAKAAVNAAPGAINKAGDIAAATTGAVGAAGGGLIRGLKAGYKGQSLSQPQQGGQQAPQQGGDMHQVASELQGLTQRVDNLEKQVRGANLQVQAGGKSAVNAGKENKGVPVVEFYSKFLGRNI